MHDAIVPAAPPEKRLNNFIWVAVIVRVAARVDPPRVLDRAPPREFGRVDL
jgi:hypothetical protein